MSKRELRQDVRRRYKSWEAIYYPSYIRRFFSVSHDELLALLALPERLRIPKPAKHPHSR